MPAEPIAAPRHPSHATREADLAACRAAIRTGSKSFHAASRLLPARYRDPALALYAFCRLADDAVDLHDEKPAAVLRLEARLDAAYAGRPEDAPADRAFARMVAETGMPRALPDALIEGLAWDAMGRRYATLSELRAYASRVASAVGVMMAVIMGVREAGALARAADLGVAMQLTNIARDVGEDAAAGRVYLPTDWLAGIGESPESFLADPRPTPAVRGLVAALLAEAEALYRRSEAGIPSLPAPCRPGILAARLIYDGIGAEIAAADHDSLTRRAHTSSARKLALLAEATARAPFLSTVGRDLPPLPETAFLVEAAAVDAAPARALSDRIAGLMETLQALEARDRAIRASRVS
ncbi:MAG: phytoene/squalene synthase family protein [Pseudomonadota bacterium]